MKTHGHDALIGDPSQLEHRDGALWLRGEPIDFVYNRLTDFALATPASAVLRDAYLAGDVALSPHPRAHALYADKRGLIRLGDADFLRAAEAEEEQASIPVHGRRGGGVLRGRMKEGERSPGVGARR